MKFIFKVGDVIEHKEKVRSKVDSIDGEKISLTTRRGGLDHGQTLLLSELDSPIVVDRQEENKEKVLKFLRCESSLLDTEALRSLYEDGVLFIR